MKRQKNDGGLTFNCGVIKGGTVRNTVPDSCEFVLDVRFCSSEEFSEAKSIIQRIADTSSVPGTSCEAIMTNLRIAMEPCERNLNLLRVANESFKKNGLSELCVGMRNGGSDAADVTAFGIPCLDSLGIGGERGHSREEYGVISSLAESAKRIVSIITSL